jgi:hypothetical protein
MRGTGVHGEAGWTRTGSVVSVASLALLALLVGGCASPPPDSITDADVPPASASPTEQTPTALPTEPPLVLPPGRNAGTSTGPVDPAAPLFPDGPCQPSQLDVSASPVDPALGYRQMRVRVTNSSRVPCVLTGYAVVSARGPSGTVFANPRGRLHDSDAAAAQTVPLDPGDTAHVDLGWRGDLAAAGIEQTASMTIVVTDGSSPLAVPLDRSSPVDIVDGTEIRVGGWRHGPD